MDFVSGMFNSVVDGAKTAWATPATAAKARPAAIPTGSLVDQLVTLAQLDDSLARDIGVRDVSPQIISLLQSGKDFWVQPIVNKQWEAVMHLLTLVDNGLVFTPTHAKAILHLAVEEGRGDVVGKLFASPLGAEIAKTIINQPDLKGMRLLAKARATEQEEVANLLMENDASSSCTEKLYSCCSCIGPEKFKWLQNAEEGCGSAVRDFFTWKVMKPRLTAALDICMIGGFLVRVVVPTALTKLVWGIAKIPLMIVGSLLGGTINLAWMAISKPFQFVWYVAENLLTTNNIIRVGLSAVGSQIGKIAFNQLNAVAALFVNLSKSLGDLRSLDMASLRYPMTAVWLAYEAMNQMHLGFISDLRTWVDEASAAGTVWNTFVSCIEWAGETVGMVTGPLLVGMAYGAYYRAGQAVKACNNDLAARSQRKAAANRGEVPAVGAGARRPAPVPAAGIQQPQRRAPVSAASGRAAAAVGLDSKYGDVRPDYKDGKDGDVEVEGQPGVRDPLNTAAGVRSAAQRSVDLSAGLHEMG